MSNETTDAPRPAEAREILDSAVQNQPEEKKGCRKGCRRGCLLFVLIFGFPLWWIGCHTTSLRVSEQTTRALGPMTSDGKRIDYFRAMEEKYYPPEMKTDDNGYRLMVRAFGDISERKRSFVNPETGIYEMEEVDVEPLRLQVYEKLGLDPNLPPALFARYEDWSSQEAARREADKREKEADEDGTATGNTVYELHGKTLDGPWTLDDCPFMKEWVETSGPAIDLVGQAVRKPVFRIPWVRDNENTPVHECLLMLDEIRAIRDIARTVASRAWYRIGTGDLDGALYDMMTLHRLARYTGKQGTLVCALVGIAIEGVALSIGVGENPDHPLTKEQLERWQSELAALPQRMTLEEAIESERYFSLAAFQDIYWGNLSGFPGGPLPEKLTPILGWTYDINIMMASFNRHYDKLVDKTLRDEELEMSKNPFRYLTVRGRTEQFSRIMMSLSLPAMQAAREAWRRMECTVNMQHLTLALLLYEKEHAALPEGDWREAVRPYLPEDSDRIFCCPTRFRRPFEEETTYALIEGTAPGRFPRILLAEVLQAQKLGQGDGRFPRDKAKFWQRDPANPGGRRPDDFDGLGSFHSGGANVTFWSGGTRFLAESMLPEALDALLDEDAPEEQTEKP